jgi:hypothetical protein
MDQQNDKRKPEAEFRAGPVSASVWRNEVQRDGQTILRYSTRIQKRFRKDDGSYESTEYYFPEDLPKLILCAQRAFEYTELKERKDLDEAVPV